MIGTALAGVTTGGVGVAKAYFHYKVRLIELQNKREHEIEDRRNDLEDRRARTNEELLSRFQITVKALAEEAESVKDRLGAAEQMIGTLRGEISRLNDRLVITDEWISKVNAHFVKKDQDQNGTEITQLTPDLVRVGVKKS